MIKLKIILNEAKSIEDEYKKDWSMISRDIFDQIIVLDPQTNIEKNVIGPNAKQLLLPKYRDGETDFLNNADAVKNAIDTFIKNRAKYEIKNIALYPSVDIFVKHINDPENNPVQAQEIKKESKIDELYKKYYSNIPKEDFDYILSIDIESNNDNIGSYAKNLLLPLYTKEENKNFILDKNNKEKIQNAIKHFPETLNYLSSEDKKILSKYTNIEDFIKTAIEGETSQQYSYVMNNPAASHVKYIGSTIKYDVWEVLDTWGAAIVAGAEKEQGGPGLRINGNIYESVNFNANAYGHWCTTTQYYWPNYRRDGEKYYDFIVKSNPASNSRRDNYQLSVKPNGNNRQACTGEEEECVQNEVFAKDPQLLELCSTLPDDCYLSKIQEVVAYKAAKEFTNKPFLYNGEESINNIKQRYPYHYKSIFALIKELIIDNNITQISPAAFAGWSSLERITFSNNLKMIGSHAFKNCISLGLIKFPETLEYIGVGAFSDCSALHGNLIIPNSVKKIGRGAFDGTQVKLSLLSDRKTPLDIRQDDVDWFGTNSKVLNILQDSFDYHKNFEESLYEEYLDENIPRDLVNAYKNALKADAGGVGEQSQNSNHRELDSANRRQVKWDYSNSTYTKLSYEEAREYLGLDHVSVAQIASRLPNLRLIIDGKLAEWENHNGKIYYLYSVDIPWDRISANNSEGFRSKNSYTNNTKFAQKASDIDLCLRCADKIYQTDEYEHPLYNNQELINLRTDKNTGYTTYDRPNGNEDPDSPNSKYNYIKVSNRWDNNDTEYDWKNDPDDTYNSKFNVRYSDDLTRKGIKVRDTGAHNLKGYNTSNTSKQLYNAIKNKKTAHDAYTDARLRLKILEDNQDLYDPEEYEVMHTEAVENKDKAFDSYKAAYDEYIKAKKTTADGWTIRLNKIKKLIYKQAISTELFLKTLEKKDKELRDVTIKLEDFKKKSLLDNSEYKDLISLKERLEEQLKNLHSKVESHNRTIEYYKAEIKRYEELIQEEELNKESTIKACDDKIKEIENAGENIEESAAEIAEKMAAERRKMENTVDELRDLLNKYGYKKFDKKTVKEIDDKLKALIRIVDAKGNPIEDETSETTEEEVWDEVNSEDED